MYPKSLRRVLFGSMYTKTGKVFTMAAPAALLYQLSSWLIFSLGKSIILVIGESPTTFMNISLLHQKCPAYFVPLTWIISGCIVASKICLKQHTAFLCSFHLAFSLCVFLNSWWCIYTIVLVWLQLGKIHVLFYQRDQISIWSLTCKWQSMLYPWVCWYHFQ